MRVPWRSDTGTFGDTGGAHANYPEVVGNWTRGIRRDARQARTRAGGILAPATAAPCPGGAALIVAALIVALWVGVGSPDTRPIAQAPQDLADAAEADFAQGHLVEAVAKYDRLATMVPDVAPMLWQRGIALYELGRYAECAQQFASYFAVNRTDLENATWHFLCAARSTTPAAALAGILAAGPDARILRSEVFAMIRGRMSPDALMALADTSVPIVRFYAHFYIGYYLESTGNPSAARPHFAAAASPELSEDAGFLAIVARIHLSRLRDVKIP